MRGLTLVGVIVLAVPFVFAEEKKPAKDEFKLSADEQKVLDLTNAERKTAGVEPLKANPKLFAAARGHSANMGAKAVIAHELDGKNFDVRIKDEGYKFRAAAENVAMGQRTPAEVVESWMNSAGHKLNMLNKTYTEIGIGVGKDADGRLYWTQVFGTPLE